jgi:hypothetical protein
MWQFLTGVLGQLIGPTPRVQVGKNVVISYRRFGATYRSHLQGVKNPILWYSFMLEGESTPGA